MRIEVLSIDACPNSRIPIEEVEAALAALDLSSIPAIEHRVVTLADVVGTAFAGSPTVLIDGIDVIPETVPTENLACRVYRTASGMIGHPTRAQIIDAIHARSGAHQ